MAMKHKIYTLVLALSWASQAYSDHGGSDELFLEIWDGVGKSYIRDLGINQSNFITAPGCYANKSFDLTVSADGTGTDTAFADLTGGGALPDTATWAVMSFNAADTTSPVYGILTTVVNSNAVIDQGNPPSYFLADIFGQNGTFTTAQIAGHLTNNNVKGGSKVFIPGDEGYFLGSDTNPWNTALNGMVAFEVNQLLSVGQGMGMYFLVPDPSDLVTINVGNQGQPFGQWTFDGKTLSFTTSTPPVNPCPVDNPSSGGNNGGGNNGGGNNGGDGGGTSTPTPSKPVTSTSGFLFPKSGDSLKVGMRHPIGWNFNDIAPGKRLNLYFSKNGGQVWKLVKTGLRANGYYLWKPNRSRATSDAKLALCLPQSKTSLVQCTTTDGTFAIVK